MLHAPLAAIGLAVCSCDKYRDDSYDTGFRVLGVPLQVSLPL